MEAAFVRAFARLVRELRSPANLEKAARLVRAGAAPHAVVEAIGFWDPRDPMKSPAWGNFHAGFMAAQEHALEAAGGAELAKLPRASRHVFAVGKAAKPRVPISVPVNPYSIKWIKQSAGDRVREISEKQRATLRRVVERNYAEGVRPEEMMADIARTVGLTDRQEEAVEKRRQLALENGADEDRADAMADRYAQQSLAQRAEAIARTETKDAQEEGRQDAWLVARDEGLLPPTATRRWSAASAGPVLCEICAELDDQTTSLDEPWHSDVLGDDVDRPPAHTSCRCTVVLDFE